MHTYNPLVILFLISILIYFEVVGFVFHTSLEILFSICILICFKVLSCILYLSCDIEYIFLI